MNGSDSLAATKKNENWSFGGITTCLRIGFWINFVEIFLKKNMIAVVRLNPYGGALFSALLCFAFYAVDYGDNFTAL